MALTAQQVEDLIYLDRIPKLSERDIKICICGVLAQPTMTTAQQAVDSATSKGYKKLSRNQLRQCLAVVLNNP